MASTTSILVSLMATCSEEDGPEECVDGDGDSGVGGEGVKN